MIGWEEKPCFCGISVFEWYYSVFQWHYVREESTMTAYCVKCKSKREMQDGEKVTMKNGRPAMMGKCPVCGTGLYRIMPSS